MTAYQPALKTVECYLEKYHLDLNEAVYYMVFLYKLMIYHCFKSSADTKQDLNEVEIFLSFITFRSRLKQI